MINIHTYIYIYSIIHMHIHAYVCFDVYTYTYRYTSLYRKDSSSFARCLTSRCLRLAFSVPVCAETEHGRGDSIHIIAGPGEGESTVSL